MQMDQPNEKNLIERPKSINYSPKNLYRPQNVLLEGYTQMPRQLGEPYGNKTVKPIMKSPEKIFKTMGTPNFKDSRNQQFLQTSYSGGSTSYLVAPINLAESSEFKTVSKKNQMEIKKYIKFRDSVESVDLDGLTIQNKTASELKIESLDNSF